MKTIHIQVAPVSAPRQVRSDKWKNPPRPCVARYRAFRDEIERYQLELDSPFSVIFKIPMPKSWSKRKKEIWDGKPHMNKPDLDNLIKALLDSVYRDSDDKHIWSFNAQKFWAYEGAIEVSHET